MLRVLMLATALLPTGTYADPRPATGLLSKQSPLPATIPLQVRTSKGHDYAISLQDDKGSPMISGYQRGGDFFRLLVPPGRHDILITAGQPDDWQSDQRFTTGLKATVAMDFAIRANRREGHQITAKVVDGELRLGDRQDQTICQSAEWDSIARETTEGGTPLRHLDQSLSTRSRLCD